MIELSVVIAARNAAPVITGQLAALVAQEWDGDWEVVVVDNGSTDATASMVRAFDGGDGRIRLITANERSGAGHARNIGVEAARGARIAFCDADDVVEPGWVEAMATALRQYPCVGGRLLLDRLNPEWLQAAFYRTPPDRLESFAGIFPFTPTCNLGCQRDILMQLGGFDEDYLTGQDIELCLRLWLAGHRLAYVRDAQVQYRYRADLRALWRRSRQYGAVGPRLARRLADLGLPTPPPVAGLRQWLWLVRHLPALRTLDGRARWLVVAGGKVGRLQGSMRARHIYL